jgi:DNA-binding YbaB/EbfC family protein
MFDALKNMGGLGGLMEQVRTMQEQMKKLQQELAAKQVTADAGGGMVQATVNGRMELVKLKIDKSKIDISDTEMLEDVIVAAVHGAQTRASEMVQEEMKKKAGEMGLPPGLLGQMGA